MILEILAAEVADLFSALYLSFRGLDFCIPLNCHLFNVVGVGLRLIKYGKRKSFFKAHVVIN